MKKFLALVLIAVSFSSCGVSIQSVVDKSAMEEPYTNPYIVIPYEKFATRNFSKQLKKKIEGEFALEQKKVEVYIFENKANDKLSLNHTDEAEEHIGNTIASDKKDLLLIFTPTNLQYHNGGLQSATYELTGIDTRTKKEVWKAKMVSSSSFGPAMFAEKSAKKIYLKLKTDKVL